MNPYSPKADHYRLAMQLRAQNARSREEAARILDELDRFDALEKTLRKHS